MFGKEEPVQKPVWRQFSFYCLISVLLIVAVKKTVSLGVTPFLLLTALNYFLLGLLIGDLGWGFFSAHSKSLYLKTNWLLRIPFGILNMARRDDGGRASSRPMHQPSSSASSSSASSGSSSGSRPVVFADMVAEPSALFDDDSSAPSPSSSRHTPARIPAHVQYASASSRAEEDSLLGRAAQERHSPEGNSSSKTSPANNEAFLLASLDRPLSPAGNGSEVAQVLAQHQARPRPIGQSASGTAASGHHSHAGAPSDDMLSALMEAHGVSW